MKRNPPNPNVVSLAAALQKSREGQLDELGSEELKALQVLSRALAGTFGSPTTDDRRSAFGEWIKAAKPGDMGVFPISDAHVSARSRDLKIKARTNRAIVLHGSFSNPIMETMTRVEILDKDGNSVRNPGSGSDSDDDGDSGSVSPESDGAASGS